MTFPSRLASLTADALPAVGPLLIAGEKLTARLRPERAQFANLRRRFYREIWEQAAKEIGAELEPLGDDYLRIRRGDRFTFVKDAEVARDARLVFKISGNKPLALRLLAEAGAPTPRHLAFGLATLAGARDFVRELGGAAVVKPALEGSAGRGVTTGIRTPGALWRAALRGAAYHPRLLVEEQVPGDSYRLYYVDGQLVDAVRRDPCSVTGDGLRSIRELVQEENRARLAAGTSGEVTAFHPLRIDLELRAHLKARGRSLSDVPGAGEVVAVKRVVNQNARRENHSVTDRVHPETVALGERVVEALGIELGGIDLLSRDISRPLPETGGVVNEVNTAPGLHHHYLVSNPGAGARLATRILEHVLR